MIRKGETSAKIQIIFDNGDVLSRTREPGKTKCRINGKAATLKAVDEFLVKETGGPGICLRGCYGMRYDRANERKRHVIIPYEYPSSVI